MITQETDSLLNSGLLSISYSLHLSSKDQCDKSVLDMCHRDVRDILIRIRYFRGISHIIQESYDK